VKVIPSHVSFISKSNSENYIEVRWFLTKLQTKISWLLFVAHGVALLINREHFVWIVWGICPLGAEKTPIVTVYGSHAHSSPLNRYTRVTHTHMWLFHAKFHLGARHVYACQLFSKPAKLEASTNLCPSHTIPKIILNFGGFMALPLVQTWPSESVKNNFRSFLTRIVCPTKEQSVERD